MNMDFLRALASIVPLEAVASTRQPPNAAAGPNPCCADFSIVTACDHALDTHRCGVCGAIWIDACPNADLGEGA